MSYLNGLNTWFSSLNTYLRVVFFRFLATHLATQLATQCYFWVLGSVHKKIPVFGAKCLGILGYFITV